MTSHWMRSTPAASSAATSSPSREKSAGRTEGTIWIGLVIDPATYSPEAIVPLVLDLLSVRVIVLLVRFVPRLVALLDGRLPVLRVGA